MTDTGGIDDKSFNQQTTRASRRRETELGIEPSYVNRSPRPTTRRTSRPSSTRLRPDRHGRLQHGTGASCESAKANPDQKFAIVDFDFFDFPTRAPKDVTLDNVEELTFQTDQAAFLAGYLAAG